MHPIISSNHSPEQNHLFASLSQEIKSRLTPHMKLVSLPLGKVLFESGDLIRDIYLPTDSIVSLMYIMNDGASAEISIVGNDGFVGIAILMGGESTSTRAVVQSAGSAYRLNGSIIKKEFNRHGELLELVLRYTQSLMTQIAQTAVCNRHHNIHQQLCRLLLVSLDRLPSNELIMTQELIANMLGVRREGVTQAAGHLQSLGIIDYHRGHITILDRAHLERMSCECYAVVKSESVRLLPTSPPIKLAI